MSTTFFRYDAIMLEKPKAALKKKLEMLSYILRSEKDETKKMLEVYIKHLKGNATPEELDKAATQFRMVLKSAGLGVFLILPLAPITLPLILYLGKKLKVKILPDSYHQAVEKAKKETMP